MEPIIGCTEEYYNNNESAFFKLIHNTFLSKHKSDLLGIEEMPITNIYELVFKEHPSKANLKIFFSNEVIQGLW